MVSGHKCLWSVRVVGTVIGTEMERSEHEGSRSVIKVELPDKRFISLRLTKPEFHHLFEKMVGRWNLKQNYTVADGEKLHRWVRHKTVKVRVRGFTKPNIQKETHRAGVDNTFYLDYKFIELLD